MGFWSSVGSFLSGACRAACSCLSAVGSFAMSALSLPGRILGAAISGVVSFAERFMQKPREETPEELGEKAMISDKKPENFDSINDYIKHLRNDIQVDNEKMLKLTDQEKTERQAIGASIYVKQIEENFGSKLPIEFFETIGKLNMSSSEMKTYIDSFKKNGLDDMGKMASHLKGTLPVQEADKIDKAIKEGKQEEAKNEGITKTPEQINSEVLEMQRIMREIELK